jgi:hypothetical protein
MPRNLVISPVGGRSRHRTWIGEPSRQQFDLFLIDYANPPAVDARDARYYVHRPGLKWELIASLADEHADTLGQYDAIWCPDDDIAADTATVNRLFELFHQHQLQLAQPAIASGQVSYRTLLRRPRTLLRYTPFVEVMCPIFSRQAFWKAVPTFLLSRSGWGIDWAWTKLFRQSEMAILDAAAVDHTGLRAASTFYRKLADQGISPMQEFRQVAESIGGIDWRLHRKFRKGHIRLPAVKLTNAHGRQANNGPGREGTTWGRWWARCFRRAA